MNIDDRLRSAQKTQLEKVGAEVRRRGLDQPPNRERPWPWLLAMAAAVAVVAVIWLAPREPTELVTTAASPSLDGGAATGATPPPSTSPTTAPVSTGTTAPSATGSTVTGTTAPSATGSTVTATTAPSGTASTATAPGATAPGATASTVTAPTSTTSGPGPELHPGVANNVCGTGLRAPLEDASLRYVSEETGWNRLADLVNEQDGPFYFGLWEPDYPGTVSVQVGLSQPVAATEIRLAQHPYQDVSGTITVETAGQVIAIELSGRDGFRSHRFTQPTVIDSFVITRTEAAANITEVIVCVERS